MTPAASNYNPLATVDDGSCNAIIVESKEGIPTAEVEEVKIAPGVDPISGPATQKDVEMRDLLEKDNLPGLDPIYKKNIDNIKFDFGFDKDGDEDDDVEKTTTIGGVVQQKDKDGDVSYHYTEDSEKYNSSWFSGILGKNKASKEDIKEFNAQLYLHELQEEYFKIINDYKPGTVESDMLINESTRAAAIAQIQFKKINRGEAEARLIDVNKSIKNTNKKLNYEFNASEIVKKLQSYKMYKTPLKSKRKS